LIKPPCQVAAGATFCIWGLFSGLFLIYFAVSSASLSILILSISSSRHKRHTNVTLNDAPTGTQMFAFLAPFYVLKSSASVFSVFCVLHHSTNQTKVMYLYQLEEGTSVAFYHWQPAFSTKQETSTKPTWLSYLGVQNVCVCSNNERKIYDTNMMLSSKTY
jgi:hypothetical protein